MKITKRLGMVIGDALVIGGLYVCLSLWVMACMSCFVPEYRMPAYNLLILFLSAIMIVAFYKNRYKLLLYMVGEFLLMDLSVVICLSLHIGYLFIIPIVLFSAALVVTFYKLRPVGVS
jgi:hypothetical protein